MPSRLRAVVAGKWLLGKLGFQLIQIARWQITFFNLFLTIAPIVARRGLRPVNRMTAAHHHPGNVLRPDEASSNDTISVRGFGVAVSRSAGTNLHAANLL